MDLDGLSQLGAYAERVGLSEQCRQWKSTLLEVCNGDGMILLDSLKRIIHEPGVAGALKAIVPLLAHTDADRPFLGRVMALEIDTISTLQLAIHMTQQKK